MRSKSIVTDRRLMGGGLVPRCPGWVCRSGRWHPSWEEAELCRGERSPRVPRRRMRAAPVVGPQICRNCGAVNDQDGTLCTECAPVIAYALAPTSPIRGPIHPFGRWAPIISPMGRPEFGSRMP